MSNEYVTVRNLLTKRVGKVRRRIAEKSPVLEIVPAGTKNFVPLTDLVSGSGPDIESYVPDKISVANAEDAEDARIAEENGDVEAYEEFVENSDPKDEEA